MLPVFRLQSSQLLCQIARPRLIQWAAPYFPTSRSVRFNATTTTVPARSRWPRRILYIAIFGSLGLYTGKRITSNLSSPAPGTPEDAQRMQQIQEILGLLPIVRGLRADPNYSEWEAYDSLSEEDKKHRLTSGPLKGSRGLAVQKIFWNEKDKEGVVVVYFGHGLDGWLSIVHGGALATVIDEALGRVALRSLPARTGVTANLNITYRAPVSTGEFYSIHARLDEERSTDRKAYVDGEIRSMTGKLCAEGTGLFVVPKSLALRKIGDEF